MANPPEARTARTAICAAVATERMVRLLVGLGGLYMIASFAFSGRPDATTASLSIIAFVLGGVRIAVSSASGDGEAEKVDTSSVIALGSALACGPAGSVGPAAMAALGELLFGPGERDTFWRSAYKVARLVVMAFLAGSVFVAFGGKTASPFDASSFPAALAAAVVYAIIGRILGVSQGSACGLAVALGIGYALGGAARALPVYSVLIPGLPIAVTVLVMLQRRHAPVMPEGLQTKEPKPSLIDPVTGLANQRYLEMFLHQETSRALRSGRPLTVLLIDIDDFRRTNEISGSSEADRSMAALGAGIKQMLREYDVVARYKDDEFVVVLPDTDADAGTETARRLHSALSGRILPLRISFSTGVATYPVHGTTVDNLLASAHHALNRAKFSGKNSVVSCLELAKAS